jgi:hypothetical protein
MATEPINTTDDEIDDEDVYTAPPNPDREPFGVLYIGFVLSGIGALLLFAGVASFGAVLLPVGVVLLCTGLVLQGIHRAGERVARVVADAANYR